MKVLLVAVIVFLSFTLNAQKKCISNNCTNGLGVCEYVGVGIYSGHFKNGYPEGEGRLEYTNGDKYFGWWSKGKKSGTGKYIFNTGITYQGEFLNDFFNGFGTMIFLDQSSYEGNWKAGKRHGKGTLIFQDGEKVIGEWEKGQYIASWDHLAFRGFEGILDDCNIKYCNGIEGKYNYKDGKKYLGYFLDGVPSGVGTVFYPNGDIYEGNWAKHNPEGKGTMFYAKGNAVGAIWEKGKPKHKLFNKPHDGNASSDAKQVKIWAVIIGAAAYSRMTELEFTDDDAQKIYNFLTSPSGGKIPNYQVQLLLDQQVTRNNVLQAVQTIYSQADYNDVIIFYFSGHGTQNAFLAIDSDGASHPIQHRAIKYYIDQSLARHKIIIADACHAGTFAYNSNALAAVLRTFYDAFEKTAGGVAFLMSSRAEEYSYEDQRLNSGIFSYFLLEGLNGAADEDGNEIITLGEAFDYVSKKVSNFTGKAQQPVLSGTFDRNIPLAQVMKY